MNIKTPINENYVATIVKINSLVQLDNCSNVVHTPIFGHLVVVSKETKAGDIGIFLPVETRLSNEYLHNNNLYRDNTKNKDADQKGYFEDNGRIRCVKFRGHKSEGLFMPLKSLLFAVPAEDLAKIDLNTSFDQINGIPICEKYVPKHINTPGEPGSRKGKVVSKKKSKLVENQFRFHGDTAMLGKNVWKIKPDTLISITNKLHGTSFVVSNILCKKKQTWWEKLLGLPVKTDYDVIYSSRKVIKNDDLNKNNQHYYGEDVWAEIAEYLKPFMPKGMTIYGEAVGYTKSGKIIQSGYDYGYKNPQEYLDLQTNEHLGIYIYRITLTNVDGKVFEYSAKQVQDWCKANGLKAVPQFFYGRAWFAPGTLIEYDNVEFWQGEFLSKMLSSFNMEKDCDLCVNKVPAEGIVVRIEGLDYDAYKLKSFRFREHETKQLDKGEIDLETQESQE